MLQFIRDKASSWIVKFILGLIIVVFIFFGWGTYKSGKMNQIASVNGKVITPGEYKTAYNQLVQNVKQRFGGNLSSEIMKMLNLEKQALDGLINEILILQKAEDLGISISDNELASYISGIEYFQTDNHFDNKKYEQLLAANRMSTEQFEYQIRRDLVKQRVSDIVSGAVKITDKELQEWYDFNNKTVDIKYAAFIPGNYDINQFQITDEEIKAFYDKNKENYKSEEVVKAAYLRFAVEDFKKDVSVTENEIKTYYQDNIEDYKTPESVKAKHILIKVSKDASDQEVLDAKKEIESIKSKIESGKSFEDMAKKYSQGPSSVNGGDLGEFRRGDMVKPFADAAFSTEAGALSDPVRTDFGWHIIKVEEKKPASVKELLTVKNEIKNILLERKAKVAAYDKADAVYEATLKGSSLEEEANARNIKLDETDYFTRRGPQSGILSPDKFAQQAFSYGIGETSEIIEAQNTMYILQVRDKKEPAVLGLDKVKDKIKDILYKEKQQKKAKEDAESFLAEFKNTKTFEGDYKIVPSEIKSIKEVKRQGFVKDLGTLPKLQQKVFEVAASNAGISDSVVETSKGFYIFSVVKVNTPSSEDFEKDKNTLKQDLLNRKKSYFFSKWMEDYRSKSEITVSDRLGI